MASTTYSTWQYYSVTYLGKLDAAQYTKLSALAKIEIDRQSRGRAASAATDEAVALQLCICECELVDALNSYDQIPYGVRSVSNDGYRLDYGSLVSGDNLGTETTAIVRICRKYMTWPVNLMYGGVDACTGP